MQIHRKQLNFSLYALAKLSMMTKRKTIVVTGSSSGIGMAIIKELSGQHHCIGLSRNHPTDQINDNFTHFYCDLSQTDQLETQFKQLKNMTESIDVIICNAGFGRFVELEQFSVQEMQDMMNVNFLSHAILVKTLLPSLKRNKSGKIIFIGSESGLSGAKKGSLYCASKFALRGFSQSIREECKAAGITVSLINPGFVNTNFFDRLNFQPSADSNCRIEPETIASTVALIIENQSGVFEEINIQPMKKKIEKNYLVEKPEWFC